MSRNVHARFFSFDAMEKQKIEDPKTDSSIISFAQLCKPVAT